MCVCVCVYNIPKFCTVIYYIISYEHTCRVHKTRTNKKHAELPMNIHTYVHTIYKVANNKIIHLSRGYKTILVCLPSLSIKFII